MTDETAASTPAEDQPPAGIDKTIDAPPVAPGMVRTYWDRPIESPPAPPLIDVLASFLKARADDADAYAARLYAEADTIHTDQRRAEGAFASEYAIDPPAANPEAAHALQVKFDSYYSAISNLRHAAEHLRLARLALSAYIDPKILERGY